MGLLQIVHRLLTHWKRGQDGGEKEEISNMFMSTRVQSVILFGYNIIKEEQPL